MHNNKLKVTLLAAACNSNNVNDVHCDEEDIVTTRDRTPAHEVHHFQKILHDVLAKNEELNNLVV